MKKFRYPYTLLIGLLTLLLTACPGTDTPLPGGTTLSGLVIAPAGGDVAGTTVFACVLVGQTCDAQQTRTVTLSQAGASSPFTIEVLPGVQYTVIAFKDINANGTVDAGDYRGTYTLDGQTDALVTAPAANLTIQMTVFGSTPGPGPNPSGLSGTVTAPQGGDIAGTSVFACFVENNQCNAQSPNTQLVQINTSGASAPFSFSGLAAGQYTVIAVKDVNGDGQRNAGDYAGCYGGAQCTAVTPPQSNLTVQMEIESDGGIPGTGTITGTLVFPGDRGGSSLAKDSNDLNLETPAARSAKGQKIIPGEVIVKFVPQAVQTLGTETMSFADLGAKLSDYRFQGRALQIERALGVANSGLYRVLGLNVAQTLELASELSARPDVLYAEPNALRYALKTPNDPFYGLQWHYPAINLPNAWDIEDGTSNPVTVAVIDTGSIPHPDLSAVFVGGYDFVSDPQNGGDGDGRDADATDLGQESGYHGAHVAGTVAASTNNGVGLSGVSWGAKILPVRVLGVTGGGSTADIVDASLWAGGLSVAGTPTNPNPAKILNLSLGGEGPCSGLEQDAFNDLKANGVVVVIAAGNDNDDAGFYSPGNCQNVITVGATGPQGKRAPYSNYGERIDVMAPGGDSSQTIDFEGEPYSAGVWSTLKNDQTGKFNYVAYQGTSMATPHIAGVAALMLAKDPTLTPDAVLAQLKASATPLDAVTCNRPAGTDCGAGLIDAVKALGTGGGTPPPPPPPPTGSLTTYVAALRCTSDLCNDFDVDRSKLVVVEADLLQKPYVIEGLEPAKYVVAGWQDLNENEEIDNGEPFGRHLNDLTVEAGQTVDRADIYLQPATVDPNFHFGFVRQFESYVAAKDNLSFGLQTFEIASLPEASLLRNTGTTPNVP